MMPSLPYMFLAVFVGMTMVGCSAQTYTPQRDARIDEAARYISQTLDAVEIADCFVLFQHVETEGDSPNLGVGELDDGSTELLTEIDAMIWKRAYEFETGDVVDGNTLMAKSSFDAIATPNGIVASDIDMDIADRCLAVSGSEGGV